MAVGDLITYDNYRAMVPMTWRITPQWSDTNLTVHLASCSFVVRARVTSVLFRTGSCTVTAYYYNGSTWVHAYTLSVSQTNAGSKEQKGYHNRATEGTTSGDSHNHHLWKFVVSMSYPGSAHGYFDIWSAGVETMTKSEYDSYFKGGKIHGIKGTYVVNTTDSAFLATYHPGVMRGTPISIASGTHKYICHEA